jgi:hypothetical protein
MHGNDSAHPLLVFCCGLQGDARPRSLPFRQLSPARFIVLASFVAFFFIHPSIFQSPTRRFDKLEREREQNAIRKQAQQENTYEFAKNIGCDIEICC